MNNDKLVLLNGTEINLESSQGIGALHVLEKNIDSVCELWKKFSKENLKQVTVKNGDGITVGKYQDMILDHTEVREKEDGSLIVTFSLREKSTVELITERLTAVEAGQVTQDAGIDDLGQVISDIMEGGGQ